MAPNSYVPYRISQPTVAGGANTGIMGALQNPDQFAKSQFLAKNNTLMGRSAMRQPFATNGGFQSGMGYGRYGQPAPSQPRIQGYVGSGIPTNEFSDITGRGPTAGDYEQINGGLSPTFDQMGSLSEFDRMNRGRNLRGFGQPSPATSALPGTLAANAVNAASAALGGLGGVYGAPAFGALAEGGSVQPGEVDLVGEKGPELFEGNDGSKEIIGVGGPQLEKFHQGGKVVPHNKMPSGLTVPVNAGQRMTGGLYGTDEMARRKRAALRSGTYGA